MQMYSTALKQLPYVHRVHTLTFLHGVLSRGKTFSVGTYQRHTHTHSAHTHTHTHHTHTQYVLTQSKHSSIHSLILPQSAYLNLPLINLYLLPALRTFKLWHTINLAHTSQKLFQGMLKQYSKQFSKVDYKFHIQVLLHITIT